MIASFAIALAVLELKAGSRDSAAPRAARAHGFAKGLALAFFLGSLGAFRAGPAVRAGILVDSSEAI